MRYVGHNKIKCGRYVFAFPGLPRPARGWLARMVTLYAREDRWTKLWWRRSRLRRLRKAKEARKAHGGG